MRHRQNFELIRLRGFLSRKKKVQKKNHENGSGNL